MNSFLKTISEHGHYGDFCPRNVSFVQKSFEFGNVFVNLVSFHLHLAQGNFGIFYLACIGKGSGEGILQVFPEVFISFLDRITVVCNLFE